jgi:histidinol-phosphate phosphatase family protein
VPGAFASSYANLEFMANIRRAVFLDRDGTLNHDPGYLDHPDKLSLLDGVAEGLDLLNKDGFLRLVVSNQSGVGRNKITLENLQLIHDKMNEVLSLQNPNAKIDAFYFCLHRPDERCECRKPKPKLLKQAAIEHELDLTRCYMIGDRLTDLQTGKNAGCLKSILVTTGVGTEETPKELKADGYMVFNSFLEAAKWISSQKAREDSRNLKL